MTYNQIFINELHDILSEQLNYFVSYLNDKSPTKLGVGFEAYGKSIFKYHKLNPVPIPLKRVTKDQKSVKNAVISCFYFQDSFIHTVGDAACVSIVVTDNKTYRVFAMKKADDFSNGKYDFCELFESGKSKIIKTVKFENVSLFGGYVYLNLTGGKF